MGVGAIAYILVEFTGVLFHDVAVRPGVLADGFGGVEAVGELLFTKYLFPFEALSLMLLVAVIGAVVVARTPKKLQDDHGGGLAHHGHTGTDATPSSNNAHEAH